MYVNKKIHTSKDFFYYFLIKDSNGFAESEGGQGEKSNLNRFKPDLTVGS